MPELQIILVATVGITVLSGAAAAALVVFGDPLNVGQRAVAEKLAQRAVVGAGALASSIALLR